jgi:hypothetical protein
MDDVNALKAFIRARVRPLRTKVSSDSDEFRAAEALLDLVSVVSGVADATAKGAEPIDTECFYLATAAQAWQGHPDFQPAWRQY